MVYNVWILLCKFFMPEFNDFEEMETKLSA